MPFERVTFFCFRPFLDNTPCIRHDARISYSRLDDVIDLVSRLNKTDAERYVDGMMESGYTVEELDQLARVIQVRPFYAKTTLTFTRSAFCLHGVVF